jgi:hypothetical protein
LTVGIRLLEHFIDIVPMNREAVGNAIAPLLADGWAVRGIYEHPDIECTEIVVAIGEICARFVCHQGLFSVDVGSLGAAGGWYNWKDVLMAAGEATPCEPLTCLEQAVALLDGAAQKVGAYLRNPVTMSRLGARWTAPSGDRTRD